MLAFIIAGGLGTRLRPLTNKIPKPMIKVGGKPFIWYQIKLLSSLGIDKFIISTGYLGEQIREYFQQGQELGVQIQYCHEEKPLGTGGAVKRAKENIGENFLLLNGDDMPVMDWVGFFDFIKLNSESNIMVVHPSAGTGNVRINGGDGLIEEYFNKAGKSGEGWTHAGICYLKKEVLKIMPEGAFDMEEEVLKKLAKEKGLHYFKGRDKTLSIGTFERLKETRAKLKAYLKDYISDSRFRGNDREVC